MLSSYRDYKEGSVIRYIDSFKHDWRIFSPSLQIGLTDKCFNKCPMCGHWKRNPKREIDVDNLIYFLTRGKELGLETVGYSGGDPLAYKDLNRLMEWHVRNNVSFGIVTGGYLPDYQSLDFLAKAEWIRVSLDAISSKVYNKVRGGVSLEKVLNSIDRMIDANANIGIGITVHKDNADDLENLLYWSMNHDGISDVRVWPVREHSDMDFDIHYAKHIANILGIFKARYSNKGISNNFSTASKAFVEGTYRDLKFKRCYVTLYQMFIDAEGDIYHCCTTAGDTESKSRALPYGNIKDIYSVQHWKVIWKKALRFSRIDRSNLPIVCRKECILRHAIANNIAEEEWERRCFQ